METKNCKNCKNCNKQFPKTLDFFYKKLEYLASNCKKCASEIAAKRTVNDSLNIKERNKKYYQINSQKIKEVSKDYRISNPLKIREMAKKYHIANAEKHKEYSKKYHRSNNEKFRFYNSKARKELREHIIIKSLTRNLRLTKEDILLNPELIETKRLIILLKRELKRI